MIIFVLAAAVVTVVIALVAVGREAFTLGYRPKQALFDLDEAVDFVADRLPDEITARLSFDDVRRIVRWLVDYLQGGKDVVEDDEAVAYILGKDETLDPDDVFAVVQGANAYLEAIGAVGGEV